MAYAAQFEEKKTLGNGYVFGAPVKDLGWFATLLMCLAIGLAGFLLGTCIAIFSMLVSTANGHHPDFGQTYRLFGLPTGGVALVLAAAYLGTFWVKRVFRRG